jgi:DNA-directed RNA polymerase alpha subunit
MSKESMVLGIMVRESDLIAMKKEMKTLRESNRLLRGEIDFLRKRLSMVPMSEEERRLRETPIGDLHLSVRTFNCLRNAGAKSLADVVTKTPSYWLKRKNFGRKSLRELKAVLQEMDLYLGMQVDKENL